jgi:hypothetical protein
MQAAPAVLRRPPTAKMEGVSQRSLKLLKAPMSYLPMFMKAIEDPW